MQLRNPEFHLPSAAPASIASTVSSSVGTLASKTAAGLASAFSHHQSTPGKLSGSPSVSSRAPLPTSSTTPAVSRPSLAATAAAASTAESPAVHRAAVVDHAAALSAADGSQAAKGPSVAAVAELAQNVTSKVQKAIDILEGSLDFDELMKVNEALSQLQDVKMHLMEWLPKEARARGLPHVVNTHPAREPSHSRTSAPSVDDDPLA